MADSFVADTKSDSFTPDSFVPDAPSAPTTRLGHYQITWPTIQGLKENWPTMLGTAATGLSLPFLPEALMAAPVRTALGIAGGAATDLGLRKAGLPAPIPELGGAATGMLIGGPSARNLLQRGVRGMAHEFFPEIFGAAAPKTVPFEPIGPAGEYAGPPLGRSPMLQPGGVRIDPEFGLTPPEGAAHNYGAQGSFNFPEPLTQVEKDYAASQATKGVPAQSSQPVDITGTPFARGTASSTVPTDPYARAIRQLNFGIQGGKLNVVDAAQHLRNVMTQAGEPESLIQANIGRLVPRK